MKHILTLVALLIVAVIPVTASAQQDPWSTSVTSYFGDSNFSWVSNSILPDQALTFDLGGHRFDLGTLHLDYSLGSNLDRGVPAAGLHAKWGWEPALTHADKDGNRTRLAIGIDLTGIYSQEGAWSLKNMSGRSGLYFGVKWQVKGQ